MTSRRSQYGNFKIIYDETEVQYQTCLFLSLSLKEYTLFQKLFLKNDTLYIQIVSLFITIIECLRLNCFMNKSFPATGCQRLRDMLWLSAQLWRRPPVNSIIWMNYSRRRKLSLYQTGSQRDQERPQSCFLFKTLLKEPSQGPMSPPLNLRLFQQIQPSTGFVKAHTDRKFLRAY